MLLYTLAQLEAAFEREAVYWIHPVPRRYDDCLRSRIRARWNHYGPTRPLPKAPAAARDAGGLLLTLPILERMRRIEGWLDDAEADLLIAAVARAAAFFPDTALVEVGSYCGKATIVLGAALEAVTPEFASRIYAVDPHDGVVGAIDSGIQRTAPTLEKFLRNIAAAALSRRVEPVVKRAFEIEWNRPIGLLLIDRLARLHERHPRLLPFRRLGGPGRARRLP